MTERIRTVFVALAAVAIGAGAELAPVLAAESRAMTLHETPQDLPPVRFRDETGRSVWLADWQGKVVLLNLWATWCPPCRAEMPTLDRLQARLGGEDFEVVALSIDRAGLGIVGAFYDENGITHLVKYVDESGKALRHLKAIGLPTTLLIDREGREIARHVGPAEWDTPEMVAFFRMQLGRDSGGLWHSPAGQATPARADQQTAWPAPHRNLLAVPLPAPGHMPSSATAEGGPS